MMNEVIERPKFDTIKWFASWLILAIGLIANYFFSAISTPVRLIGWLFLLLLVLGVISQTQKGKKWWVFIEEARNELRKIVWPTRQETVQTTIVVVLMVVVSALFLWAIDALLMQGIQFFTGK
jgi:preprotein translocase subunit SecE